MYLRSQLFCYNIRMFNYLRIVLCVSLFVTKSVLFNKSWLTFSQYPAWRHFLMTPWLRWWIIFIKINCCLTRSSICGNRTFIFWNLSSTIHSISKPVKLFWNHFQTNYNTTRRNIKQSSTETDSGMNLHIQMIWAWFVLNFFTDLKSSILHLLCTT